jgi:DNA-binding NarL/FixJ family response regulator
MSRASVLIANRDRLIRDILRLACARHEIDVVGEVDSAESLRRVCLGVRPAVVITADRLGLDPVDDVVADVLATGAKVIVLSADPSPERLAGLLSLGVSGYLFHDAAPDEVAAGVLAVARGAAVLNPTAAAMVLNQWRRLRAEPGAGARRIIPLTPREADVLAALVDGLPTKGIAQRLAMATKTVENHKIRIFDKLGVRTQAHAVSVAISNGLVPAAVAERVGEPAEPAPGRVPAPAPAGF